MPRPPIAHKVQGNGALPPGPPLRGLAVGEACWPIKALQAYFLGGVGTESQRGLPPPMKLYGQIGSIAVFMPALLPKRGVTRIPGNRLDLDW